MTSSETLSVDSIANEASPEPSLLDGMLNVSDWMPDALKPIWGIIEAYPLIGGVIVGFCFLLLAFATRFFLFGFLRRLAKKSLSDMDDAIVDCARNALFYTVVFFGLAVAVKIAKLPVGTDFLVNVFVSLIVTSWMRSAFILSSKLLNAFAAVHHRFPIIEPRTVPLLDLVIKLLVLLLGSYVLLLIWGINPIGWLASAGIVGIAVGFAAKDTLANLFSGFFILVDSPYKIGDYVNLDSGERGCVTHIGLRSTRLLSREDIEITLPNAVIANAKIVNESGGLKPHIRIAISVGVAYGSDADSVCDILQKIGNEYHDFCKDPAPRVRLRGFGASSLDFQLLGWISKPEDRGRIRHELLLKIYKEFRVKNIEIPYTKTDLYIKEFPARSDAYKN